MQGEFKKIKAHTFDTKLDLGEKVEAWLLGMNKYSKMHDYPSKVEVGLTIYNLNGKAAQWWRELKLTKNMKERKVSWKFFKKMLQDKYMSKSFFEKKIK